MENHPIPQDVTGFKFKLIGSVTIKQFLYLVAGGILAAVCFMLPIPGIIKYPLSFLFGGVGSALAFIPIEGRPMDVMLKNFLKALPAENQYIFRKRGAEALITAFFTPQSVVAVKVEQTKTQENNALEAKRALLYKTLRQSYKPDDKEQAVLSNITTYLNEASHSASPPVQNIDNQPTEPTSSLVQIVTPTTSSMPSMDLSQAVKIVTPQPKETPVAKPTPPIQIVEAPNDPPPTAAVQMQPVAPPPITPVMQSVPQQTPSPMTSTPAQSAPAASVAPDQSTQVTSITPGTSLKAGFPELPDTPNIVMGIIKDPRGKVIPNILVEIMDQQGIPVRAFKTNALGQFAAATPLPNGEYNVMLEDPRKQNEFEQIHISLAGEIFQPIEIISVDQREKLRRELFGGASSAPQVAGA